MLRNSKIGFYNQVNEAKKHDLRNRSRSPEQIIKNTKLRAVHFKNLETETK
jgi:hypothetical protein